ncbi:MAG: homoserine dehydrogenase, partial [Chloroflexota bacterium]
VGQAVAQIIQTKGAQIEQEYGLTLKIVAVATNSRGSLYLPNGLNTEDLLSVMDSSGNLADYPNTPGLFRDWDADRIAEESNADTLVEVSFTNLETGQPAIDYCRAALESGKNVSTANKGPLALAYQELSDLAQENGVDFGFESTVMAGTPAIRGAEMLKGNTISEMRGIFNGTTNFILTQMEVNQASFADALAEAQELGYAEADPSGDVDGHDAAGKVVILANVFMNANIGLNDVDTTGISQLTSEDITTAQAEGKRWKLIGRCRKDGDQVLASVAPEKLPITDPLANVGGATNAITYSTDLLGSTTLVGAGAGGTETAAGIMADILTMAG